MRHVPPCLQYFPVAHLYSERDRSFTRTRKIADWEPTDLAVLPRVVRVAAARVVVAREVVEARAAVDARVRVAVDL